MREGSTYLNSNALLSGTSLTIFIRRCRSIWDNIPRRRSIRILNYNTPSSINRRSLIMRQHLQHQTLSFGDEE